MCVFQGMLLQLVVSGTGTGQVGTSEVVNLASRGKHLTVKSPMWRCINTISLLSEYGKDKGWGSIVKKVCAVLKGLIYSNIL